MKHANFADLGLSEIVIEQLAERGIDAPFPVQAMVIPDVIAGHDVLAQSPTGSGKTLAFGLGLLERLKDSDARPSALVLAPTRELAIQIVDELRGLAHARALSIAPVYGGAGIVKQARLAARAHILVATPGRLIDLIERGDVDLGRVKLLVLDEADRMLDMGFKPAVEKIVKLTSPKRQTLLFSATLEGEVGRIARAYTTDARRHEHKHSEQRRGDVEHRFLTVTSDGKVARLVSELRASDGGRTLVFVRTKRGADRLVKKLASSSVQAVAMHGDKSQGQRERALASFERGAVGTLVATDVAARGIDVEGITHVINYDMPGTQEDYVHRIGRTARAGATGIGVTLLTRDQAGEFAAMVSTLGLERELEAAGIGRARGEGKQLRGPSPSRTGGRRGGRGGRGGRSGAGRGRPAKAGAPGR